MDKELWWKFTMQTFESLLHHSDMTIFDFDIMIICCLNWSHFRRFGPLTLIARGNCQKVWQIFIQ